MFRTENGEQETAAIAIFLGHERVAYNSKSSNLRQGDRLQKTINKLDQQ